MSCSRFWERLRRTARKKRHKGGTSTPLSRILWNCELSLSNKFFKDPYYWRNVPLSELTAIMRNLFMDEDKKKENTQRKWTDKKGKKHVAVKVLDAEEY